MAEKSRFAGLRSLREPELPIASEKPKSVSKRTRAKLMTNPDAPGAVPPAPPPPPPPPPVDAKRSRGRPPGKSSSPDYRKTTVILNRHTYADVEYYLLSDPKRDVSDLINQLLAEWVEKTIPPKKRLTRWDNLSLLDAPPDDEE